MFEREYTISDIAQLYHVCTPTVRNWISSGKLEAVEHYGCRPLWTITEEALTKFDLKYVRRTDNKLRVIRQGKATNELIYDDAKPQAENDEDIRLAKGMRALNEVLEAYPYLKEMILELADRL